VNVVRCSLILAAAIVLSNSADAVLVVMKVPYHRTQSMAESIEALMYVKIDTE
jgi:hypothetical protein